MAKTRRYSLFHPYIMSFYSKSLYRDVGQHWKGLGFTYLFILLLLSWIPMMFILTPLWWEFEAKMVPKLTEDFPEIQIQQGQISVNKPMPYIISDKSTKMPFIILDTTGKTQSLEGTSAKVLVTKTEIMVRDTENKIDTYTLPQNLNYQLDKQILTQLIDNLTTGMLIFFYPAMVILAFIYRIIQVLIYAIIGTLIFNKFIKAPLDYQSMVRLSAIAVTPAIILSTFASVFFDGIAYQGLFYFILSMLYLIFGIKANQTAEILNKPQENKVGM